MKNSIANGNIVSETKPICGPEFEPATKVDFVSMRLSSSQCAPTRMNGFTQTQSHKPLLTKRAMADDAFASGSHATQEHVAGT
jgi:hypothetical protein